MAFTQSIVQECLSKQIRNNLNAQSQRNVTPEVTMVAAFESICRNYENYMNCLTNNLQSSDHPDDKFFQLIFSEPDIRRAYKGLCTLDLEALRPNIQCLLSTTQVRSCYNTFNYGINKLVYLERQKQLARTSEQELACNVSVSRYRCETEVYTFCDSRIGQIMQDFFYAAIPQACRTITGVKSRYVNLFNGSKVLAYSETLFMAALLTLVFFS